MPKGLKGFLSKPLKAVGHFVVRFGKAALDKGVVVGGSVNSDGKVHLSNVSVGAVDQKHHGDVKLTDNLLSNVIMTTIRTALLHVTTKLNMSQAFKQYCAEKQYPIQTAEQMLVSQLASNVGATLDYQFTEEQCSAMMFQYAWHQNSGQGIILSEFDDLKSTQFPNSYKLLFTTPIGVVYKKKVRDSVAVYRYRSTKINRYYYVTDEKQLTSFHMRNTIVMDESTNNLPVFWMPTNGPFSEVSFRTGDRRMKNYGVWSTIGQYLFVFR